MGVCIRGICCIALERSPDTKLEFFSKLTNRGSESVRSRSRRSTFHRFPAAWRLSNSRGAVSHRGRGTLTSYPASGVLLLAPSHVACTERSEEHTSELQS